MTPTDPSPIYRQIAATLRARIFSGELPAQSRLPSEEQLCASCQASRITVRSALKKLEGEGLIHKVNGKGSFVSDLRTRQRQIILVLDRPVRESRHLNDLVMGAVLDAQENGFGILVTTAALLRGLLEQIAADPSRQAGVLLLRCREPRADDLDFAEKHGIPCLIEGSRRIAGRHWMAVDNAQAMRAVVDHLHGLGRRSFGLFHARTAERWSSFAERREAALRHLTALGIPKAGIATVELPAEADMGSAAYGLTAGFFADGRRPDAIICVNDLIAVQALRWLADHGHRVPEDVAVTGFDDAEFARHATPPLTTVRQDYHQVGIEAAGRLRALMDDCGNRRLRIVRSLDLVVRASTRREP